MDIADQLARCSWTQLLLMVKDRLTDVTDESKLQAMLSDLATIMGKNSQESIKVFQSDVDLANKEERLKDSDFYFRTIVERKDKKIEQLTAKNRHIEQVSSNLLAELEQSLALSANLTKEYNDLKQQFEMRSTKLLNKYILKLEKLLVEEKQTNENLQTSLLAARNEIRELKATQTKLQVVWTANEEENAFLKSKVTCYMDQINMLQKLHNKLQYKNENLINQCDILKTSSRNLNNKLSKLKGNILLFCVLRDVSIHDDVSPRIRIPYANILEVNGIQYRYDNIYWGSGQSLLPSGTTPSSSSGVGGGMYRTNSSRKMRQKEQQQPTAADTILTELEYKVRSAAYGDNHLCILSFGPMSSGKTHTVLGNNQKPGILENIVGSLLRIKEVEFLPSDPQYNNTHYSFAISAIQHYNSNSYDLLLENISKFPEGTSPRHYTKQRADHLSSLCEPIEYTQRHNAIVFKESLTEIPLINIEDLRYAVRRAEANKNIVTSYGKIKSHCIYIVKITRVSTRPPPPGVSQRTQDPSDTLFQDDKLTTVGYINVVDLASTEGSESMKSLVTAKQLHDMQNLVSDLNAICDVLKALSDKGHRAIPYKHSKITQILHPVMTDQSNTVLISHINPIESCLEQSSHSLNLVQKIRSSELYLDDSERIQKETEDLEEEGEEGEGGGYKELPSVSVGGRK